MSRILGAFIGAPGRGDSPLLLMVNGRDMDATFRLPPGHWMAELDSTAPDGRSHWRRGDGNDPDHYLLPSRSMVLLRDCGPAWPDATPPQTTSPGGSIP
jgi:glycogen operon protein